MYYNPSDGLRFSTRKQAKQHYGVSRFRRMLHNREIIFTTKHIANDELHYTTQKSHTDKE
jgi:hypothetical protein